MHIYYETKEVSKMVTDESIVQLLKSNLSEEEKKRRMIESKTDEVYELDEELKEIEKCSVKFAGFLKHNAITPYNDAMLAYLNHLIREEKDKISCGGSDQYLRSMEKYLESYKQQIEILNREMRKGETVCRIEELHEIEFLIDNLKALKHSGRHLKDALTAGSASYQSSCEYQEISTAGKVKKSKWKTRRFFSWIPGFK